MRELIEEYGDTILGTVGSILCLALAGRFIYGEEGILSRLLAAWGGLR